MKKKEAVVKPRVTFAFFGGFFYMRGTRRATVHVVTGHPLLGAAPTVFTSEVLSVDNEDSPSVIETLNTVYVRSKTE